MVSGLIQVSGPPTVTVRAFWNTGMDITSLPPLSVWQFMVDAAPHTAVSQSWFANNILEVSYTGIDPTGTGFLNLITTDPGLHSAVEAVAQAPQTIQFFP